MHGKLMPLKAYDDMEQTTESLNRGVGNKTARVVQGPTPPHHEAAALATAAPSTSLSKRPLQPATVKRKQQTATLSVQESPKSRKKQKENEHNGELKRKDLPETFESVSTVNGDDPSKIQRAKEAVQKGLGLPRILSCDILSG